MKYRSRTDIVASVLETANSGAKKTQIMYRAFLSHAQLQKLVSLLVENGLLEYDERMQTFKTTDKGFKFLTIYREMDQVLKIPPRIVAAA
jgi:predicted transcriptional regulator